MADRDSIFRHPANAVIAAWVLDILKSHGVLRRADVAATIRSVSEAVPAHWQGDNRAASLLAMQVLLDDPDSRRDLPFARREE